MKGREKASKALQRTLDISRDQEREDVTRQIERLQGTLDR
jgi:hypothetical protein